MDEETPMSTAAHDIRDETEFEGLPVVGIEYEVRGIAGGLSEPAKFNPRFFDVNEVGYLVLKIVHRAPRFDPADKKADKDNRGDDRIRVQVLDVLEGTFVDEATVKDAMHRQSEINEEGRRREEEAKGISRLAFDDDEAALGQAHAVGDHAAGLVDGCPVCEMEKAALEAEEADGAGATVTKLGKHRDD